MSEDDKLLPLKPRRDSSGQFPIWRLVKAVGAESCRWEAHDGRWITISLGLDDEIGTVVIADSEGRRQLVESYEGALEVAKQWRR
jgi:hypothetical protein